MSSSSRFRALATRPQGCLTAPESMPVRAMRMPWSRGAARVFTATLAVVAAACVGDKGVAPALRSASVTLGAIHVAPVNAIMAVGDTLSIVVHGRTLTGEPLTSFDSVEYLLQNATDSIRVQLSSSGLVTALTASGNGTPVLVNVFAFKDNVAAADQAIIQITDTRIAGATLSLQPVPPDSAYIAKGDYVTIVPWIGNVGTGDVVPNPRVRFEYSAADSQKVLCASPNFSATPTLTAGELNLSNCSYNQNVGTIGFDQIFAFQTGTAWVRANVTVYGVPLSDSVLYTLTNPTSGEVDVGPYNVLSAFQSNRSSIVIAPGGAVAFYNAFDIPYNATLTVTFDNPAAATADDPPSTDGGASGNVSPLTGYQFTMRRFLTPGTYIWTATIGGSTPPWTGQQASGAIVVQ